MLLSLGIASFSNCSHFLLNSGKSKNIPVTWPPGRERLAIRPLFTGIGFQIERNDGSGGRRRSSGVNGGENGREGDIDLALDPLHCKRGKVGWIATGSTEGQF